MRHKNKFLVWVMAGVIIMGLTGCAAAEENEIVPQDNSGYENFESETEAASDTAPAVVTTTPAETTMSTTTTEQTTKIEEEPAILNGKEYYKLEDFLFSNEGRFFQATAFQATMALFNGDIEKLKELFIEDDYKKEAEYLESFRGKKKEIDYLAFQMKLEDIKPYGASMVYCYVENSVIPSLMYLDIHLMLDKDGMWKINFMGIEG